MKTTKKTFLYIALCMITILSSCSDDSNPIAEPDKEDKLTSIVFEASKNDALKEDIVGTIDSSKKEITVTLPFNIFLKDLTPTIKSVQGTTVELDKNSMRLFIKDKDGFIEDTYNIKILNEKNTEGVIYQFSFEVSNNPLLKENILGTIDKQAKTVLVSLPNGTNVSSLTPSIEISENAGISPEGKQDFSKEVQYKVTSEDGKTINTYKVLISFTKGTEAVIQKFGFLASENAGLTKDLVGKLYKYGNKRIFVVNVDFNTNVTALTPNITFLQQATINISGPQDFSKTVVYKVTSEDGKKEKEYHVVTANPDKQALIAIYDTNYTGVPDTMALPWDITEADLDKWEGVSLNDEKSRVNSLFFSIKRITKLPEELGNLTELTSFQLSGFTDPELPKSFKNLQKITFLNFKTNSGENTGWTSIPAQIFELKKLRTLSISNHRINEVPDDIVKLKDNLRSLIISNNKVKIATITNNMEKMDNLISLNLTNNAKEMLPDDICDLKTKYSSIIKLDNDICN